MTAEVADGWLPILFLPEKAADVWGAPLAEGGRGAIRRLGPLQTVAGGLLAIGEDAAAARDLVRPTIALYVGGMGAKGKNFYNDLAAAYGYESAAEHHPGALPRRATSARPRPPYRTSSAS